MGRAFSTGSRTAIRADGAVRTSPAHRPGPSAGAGCACDGHGVHRAVVRHGDGWRADGVGQRDPEIRVFPPAEPPLPRAVRGWGLCAWEGGRCPVSAGTSPPLRCGGADRGDRDSLRSVAGTTGPWARGRGGRGRRRRDAPLSGRRCGGVLRGERGADEGGAPCAAHRGEGAGAPAALRLLRRLEPSRRGRGGGGGSGRTAAARPISARHGR